MNREDLLALRIRQLERRPKDIEIAMMRLKEARLKNKDRFDKKHKLRPQPIEKQDWVLVYDSSLDNQHSTMRKVTKRWFGPYVVKHVHDNATYSLCELDGTELKIPIVGKMIKLFKQRDASEPVEDHMEDEVEESKDLDAEEDNDDGTMEDKNIVDDED